MRKVSIDEAVEQIRELIEWVDATGQDVLIIQEGRVVAELWPAEDFWDWIMALRNAAGGRRDNGESARDPSNSGEGE